MFERPAEFAQHAHCKQPRHCRALVVLHAAPYERVMFGQVRRAELRIYPALADRHDIQVADYAQRVFKISGVYRAGVAVVVSGFKAVVPPALQRHVQHAPALGAKRRAGLRKIGAANRRYARKQLNLGYEFSFVGVYPGLSAVKQFLYFGFHLG